MYLTYAEFAKDLENFCQAITNNNEHLGILLSLHTLDDLLHAFFNPSENCDIDSIVARITNLSSLLSTAQFSSPEVQQLQQKLLQNINQLLMGVNTLKNAGLFGMLPPEIILHVLHNLDPLSLNRLSATCKFLYPQALAELHNGTANNHYLTFAVGFGQCRECFEKSDLDPFEFFAQEPLPLKLCAYLYPNSESDNPFLAPHSNNTKAFLAPFKWADAAPSITRRILLTNDIKYIFDWEMTSTVLIPYDCQSGHFSSAAEIRRTIEMNNWFLTRYNFLTSYIHVLFKHNHYVQPRHRFLSRFRPQPYQNVVGDFIETVRSNRSYNKMSIPFIFDEEDPTAPERLRNLCIKVALLNSDR